jgi:hypothetical protein
VTQIAPVVQGRGQYRIAVAYSNYHANDQLHDITIVSEHRFGRV